MRLDYDVYSARGYTELFRASYAIIIYYISNAAAKDDKGIDF
jgi:hypothetical protein